MKIALSGNSGSGKSSVARYLVERHGYLHASTGQICRRISALLFGNEDKTSLNRVSEAVRTIDKNLLIHAALRNAHSDRIVSIGFQI
jgi:adenylate kinase family enzyme